MAGAANADMAAPLAGVGFNAQPADAQNHAQDDPSPPLELRPTCSAQQFDEKL